MTRREKQSARAQRAARKIIDDLRASGHVAYFAGGCVRDLLLGLEPQDYDVATDAVPERVSSLFRQTDLVGARFGVVLVRLFGLQIEVATFRSDGTYSDGRHPDQIRFGDEREDALRRDFTMNGMFYDPHDDRVIDHVGGRADLDAGLVRAIGDPALRFEEDHLRMLRAIRFAARFRFALESATLSAIQQQAHRLSSISQERIREELRLIVTHESRVVGWERLVKSRLSDHLVKGLQWSPEASAAVGQRLAALDDCVSFPLAMACLLAGYSSVDVRSFCERLRCSNAESDAVGWLLNNLPRVTNVHQLELADIKLLRARPAFDDLTRLLRANLQADGRPLDAHSELVRRAAELPEDEVAPPPLVTGTDLIQRSVPAGPFYSYALNQIYRAQLNNGLPDRTAALDMLDTLIKNQKSADEA